MAKKKLPDFDSMTDEQLRSYIKNEIKDDLTRGDRYALTRACEMWTQETIMIDWMDYPNMGTSKWRPILKGTSMLFILDLWDKWDKKREHKTNHKSDNRRHHGQYRKNDRQDGRGNKRVLKKPEEKDKELANSQVR